MADRTENGVLQPEAFALGAMRVCPLSIVFLVNTAGSAPRYDRIEGLHALGINAQALAFERSLAYRTRHAKLPITSLGRIGHKRFLRRIPVYIGALRTMRRKMQTCDILYGFTNDLTFLALVAAMGLRRKPRFVCEITDIHPLLLQRGLLGRAARWIENFVLKRIELLVVTSPAFVTGYLEQWRRLTPPPWFAFEHKVNEDIAGAFPAEPLVPHGFPPGTLVIGYIGLLRCRRTVDILLRAAEESEGRIRILVMGVFFGTGDLEQRVREHPYVYYGGEYASPADLPRIYASMDICWSAYPYSPDKVGNWRWARTRRFYESCYFGKPVLAAAGTQDGETVAQHGIGEAISLGDLEGAVQRLLRITRQDVEHWRAHLAAMPSTVYKQTDESERLLERLKRCVGLDAGRQERGDDVLPDRCLSKSSS